VVTVMIRIALTLLVQVVGSSTALAQQPQPVQPAPVAKAPASDGGLKMEIVTGSDKGTYYQFGLDLQKLVRQQADINLTVNTSKGSIENVYAVYQRPGVQLGIVQSDVLAFVSRLETDPTLNKIAKKIRMVFPLYNEEVHILGRRGINDFEELTGKRVAIGREGSGTYLTAHVLLQLSDVKPGTTVLIDTDEALAELKAGRIDAMFYVAGYPVKLMREGVAEGDQLALVPITNKSVLELYPAAEIPGGTYAWQPAKVPTVAAKAVIVSYDYRFRDCDNVGRFAQVLARRLDWLVQNGHPKWKTVDLNYNLKGWEQYGCVKKYLGLPSASATPAILPDENPVMRAIRGILDQQ
jgi:TRAP transporter TAXI family solute receptor